MIEFIGKSGVDVWQFTLGEILDMIQARDEETQINWACSAQSPEMLPKRYKSAPAKKKTASFIKGIFE